jgi:hypothetical protein
MSPPDGVYWILRDGEPVQVTFREYSDWMMRPFEETRRVAEMLLDAFDGTVIRVSTVFLPIDHNWAGGPPILFETMVFGGPEAWDGWQDRYTTLSDAKAGHDRIVEALRKGEELA